MKKARRFRLSVTATLVLGTTLFSVRCCFAQGWRWSNPTPHGNSIVDMALNGSLSVQVTDSGQIYTGTDFLGWVPEISGTTNDLQAVKFFGNRLVYVGANGTVGYSDDGINFHTSSLATPDPGDWLVDVAVSPNLLVAVGDNAIIYTSTDGAAWTYQGRGINNNGSWLLSAAWGGGVFVIAGENGYVATSTDGQHWSTTSSGVTSDIERVTWISTTNLPGAFPASAFWAVTSDGRGMNSSNGVNWSQGRLTTNTLYAVAASSSSGVVVGNSEVFLSTNGAAWPRQTLALQTPMPAPLWPYYAAAWDSTNGVFRLAGDSGMMVEGIPTGTNYLWPEQYESSRNLLWQVAVAGDLYVAVGDKATIMTSDNGGDWSIEALPQTNSVSLTNTVFLCVGGTTNMFIAAGTQGSLAVSPNTFIPVILTNLNGTLTTNLASTLGVLWYPLPAPTTNDLAAICTFSNVFFLAGGNGTLLRSPDGTNWTAVALPTAGDLSGLAASSTRMVATGDQGLLLTSPDGTTWTQQSSGTTNGLLHVRCLGGYYLIVGETGTIMESSDGLSWSTSLSGTTEWLNDAVMVSNTCYIVGNNGTVLTSTDFTNWAPMTCITPQSLYGAATQNGQLVVVGLQGTILRNQVVPNLTSPLFFYQYSQTAGENIFYVSGYPDQQFTLDSSPDLLNWTTGPLLDLIYGSGTLTFITQLGTNPPPAQFYRATLVP